MNGEQSEILNHFVFNLWGNFKLFHFGWLSFLQTYAFVKSERLSLQRIEELVCITAVESQLDVKSDQTRGVVEFDL